MKKVLILNYHNITQNTSGDSLYSITPSTFKLHLNLIQDLKIPVVGMESLAQNSLSENYSVVLSFDDGYKSALTEVIPLLETYNYPAIFFPITGYIGKHDRLTREDLKSISNKGFEIGSHGISHTILAGLPLSDLEKELKVSKTVIEEHITMPVKHFALPYGIYNEKLIALAKELGYRSVLATGLKSNNINESSFLLYRWNITSGLSVETIRHILQTNGNLPFKIRLTFPIKRIVKTLLGPKLTETLTRKYNNG
jgi:peptidoglycan/xylan/chitin deacetylase (PgdA/CDA1 family)